MKTEITTEEYLDICWALYHLSQILERDTDRKKFAKLYQQFMENGVKLISPTELEETMILIEAKKMMDEQY